VTVVVVLSNALLSPGFPYLMAMCLVMFAMLFVPCMSTYALQDPVDYINLHVSSAFIIYCKGWQNAAYLLSIVCIAGAQEPATYIVPVVVVTCGVFMALTYSNWKSLKEICQAHDSCDYRLEADLFMDITGFIILLDEQNELDEQQEEEQEEYV
jgi:hypothetical protein